MVVKEYHEKISYYISRKAEVTSKIKRQLYKAVDERF